MMHEGKLLRAAMERHQRKANFQAGVRLKKTSAEE
jgi:hypothetical protein